MIKKCLMVLVGLFLLGETSIAQYQVNGDYAISGNLGIGLDRPQYGLEVRKRTVKYSNQHAIYRWRWGGGTDLNWKKIADIQLSDLTWRAASMEIIIFNVGSNHGSSASGCRMRYFLTARRSSYQNNDRDDGEVSGPVADYVRLVKTEMGKYEVQVRQVSDWRDMEVMARQTGGYDTPVAYLENPTNGKETGTIYMPLPNHTDYFSQGQFGGNVGIGTGPQTDYPLAVNGTIRAKEVKVEANWADFVFEEDYQLKPLEEVEEFVKENKHLPDIPSEEEVEKEGISVGEMNAKLLQKIEELMLYTIKQQKEIDRLKGLEDELKEMRMIMKKIDN
jgi:hypothetical protein